MAVNLQTTGVHHIALRVTDVEKSKRFYTETLGFPVVAEFPGLVLFSAGSVVVGVRAPDEQTPSGDSFSPFRVGLDHIALACDDEAELERVATALEEAGIWNTGTKLDDALGKRYVAFKDPDGIKWEYYRSERAAGLAEPVRSGCALRVQLARNAIADRAFQAG